MRISHLGKKYKKMSDIGRKNIGNSHRGIKLSREHVEKIINSKKGFKHTQKTKNKLSKLRSGAGNGMFGKIPKNKKYFSDENRNSTFNKRRRELLKNAIGSFTKYEWELLKIQYNFTCPCCCKSEPHIKLTKDHIVPLVKGGSNNIENIQPLCKVCNSRKHTKIIKYG